MKNKIKIKYNYDNIDFDVEFIIKYPPKIYKYEIAPTTGTIDIFHQGVNVNTVLSHSFHMDLIIFIMDKYCQVPNKKLERKNKIKRLLNDK